MEALQAKLRTAISAITLVLVMAAALSVPAVLELRHAAFAAPAALLLLGAAVFLIHTHSESLARVFERAHISLLLPVVSALLEETKRHSENRAILDKMSECLIFYGLGPVPLGLREELIASRAGRDVVGECARQIAVCLNAKYPRVTPESIRLLYEERYGDAAYLWRTKDPTLVQGLAALLADCPGLQSGVSTVPVDRALLEQILWRLETYRFDAVKDIWFQVEKFIEFLAKNGLKQLTLPSGGAHLVHRTPASAVSLHLTAVEVATTDLLRSIAAASLAATYQPLPDAGWDLPPASSEAERNAAAARLLEALSLTSLAIFLCEFLSPQAPMTRAVAMLAGSSNEAVQLALAYLEFREDLRTEPQLDGWEFVSVHYLTVNWARRVAQRRKELEGFRREIATIRITLASGEWLTRLPHAVDRTLRNIVAQELRPQVHELRQAIQDNPGVLASLQRVFRNLQLTTIERFLEARAFTAYLITFDTLGGTFAQLIECLVSSDPAVRKTLAGLKVNLEVGGKPKYVFKKYTSHVRIGIVPKGWSFDRFYEELQADLAKVIDGREFLLPKLPGAGKRAKPLGRIELIVQRFGLSGRDHYGFRSELRRDHAIPALQQLFSSVLDLNDLMSGIGYELPDQDTRLTLFTLAERMLAGSIAELLTGTLTPPELAAVEKQDKDLVLKQQLIEQQGCRNVEELARDVLRGQQQRALAESNLTRLLNTVPELQLGGPQRCHVAAAEYVDALTAIGRITLV